MINQQTMTLNLRNYYVPSYSGVDMVAIVKKLKDGLVLVDAGGNSRPFPIPLEYVFSDKADAAKSRRAWEHWKRQSKKAKREAEKRKQEANHGPAGTT